MSDCANTGRRVLAMSTLGRNGRLGNQVFQYAFLRIYAERHGLEVRVPQWIGQELFGHRDQPLGGLRLPMFHDQVGERTILDRLEKPLLNVDVCGYFQYHTSWYAPSKAPFRDLFRPVRKIREPLDIAAARLRDGGRTLIGVHLRRGDFAGGIHYAAPSCWYVDWLAENWSRWRNPVLFLASDDLAAVRPELSRFSPVVSADLGLSLKQAPYYPDYYLLSQCDVIATSNSSFSFSAAMLNERAGEFYRPSREKDGLVSFDPWDSEPCLRECNCDEQAVYYESRYPAIERAAKSYRSKEPNAEATLRKRRREMADLWLGMNEDTLRIAYNTSLGEGQRMLISSEFRGICTSDERNYAEKLRQDLTQSGIAGEWGTQYLLAAMLYWPADQLPIEHDLSAVPVWLESDYLTYLRGGH